MNLQNFIKVSNPFDVVYAEKSLAGNERPLLEKTVDMVKNNMGAIDVNILTIKQYLALTRRDKPGMVITELGNDIDIEIKSQFLSKLRCNLFTCTDDEDAHDTLMLRVFHITLMGAARRWKNLLPSGSITTWDLLEKAFIRKYCPPLKAAKKLEEIRSFKQGMNETLYQAWERSSNGITDITKRINNLECDMQKLQENIHAIQVPSNKEVKIETGSKLCGNIAAVAAVTT
nr:hypothetical protein [Tanacetum cinerariifolium]